MQAGLEERAKAPGGNSKASSCQWKTVNAGAPPNQSRAASFAAHAIVCQPTSGAIDEVALFYLRSRGVPMRVAQSLLVLAFLAESIAEIENEAIAEDIRSRLEGWLARHEH